MAPELSSIRHTHASLRSPASWADQFDPGTRCRPCISCQCGTTCETGRRFQGGYCERSRLSRSAESLDTTPALADLGQGATQSRSQSRRLTRSFNPLPGVRPGAPPPRHIACWRWAQGHDPRCTRIYQHNDLRSGWTSYGVHRSTRIPHDLCLRCSRQSDDRAKCSRLHLDIDLRHQLEPADCQPRCPRQSNDHDLQLGGRANPGSGCPWFCHHLCL